MGKLFQLGKGEVRKPAHTLAKRTRHFIHKKTSSFTQQAYHFQHPQRPASFYQSLFSTSASSIQPPASLNKEEEEAYAAFRQAYTQFLTIHQLHEEPSSWKEAFLTHHDLPLSLNACQLQFQELVYEVIRTEKIYVHDLTLAYKIFAEDALTWSELPQPLRLIFDNLLQIIRLHLGLLDELKKRQKAQQPILRTIADLFLSYTPRFLHYYSAYFVHFETANDVVVSSMAASDPLGAYLKARSAWPECRNLTLQSFLLKPVQRLMKYPLFFKSLSDALPTHDPDRINHLRTLHELKTAIHQIEVDKKDHEDFRKLDDLASRITGFPGELAQKHRRLVYEGPLTLLPLTSLQRSITKDALGSQHYAYLPIKETPKLTRSFSASSLSSSSHHASSKEKLYVFLFNDMVLCTKIRSKPRSLGKEIKPGTTYGPTPNTLFKLTQPPGKVTFVDRAVCRYASSDHTFHRRVHPTLEEHPNQFICSIASPHITTYHFETIQDQEQDDQKSQWCDALTSVLELHTKAWHLPGTTAPKSPTNITTTLPFDPLSWAHKPLPPLLPSSSSSITFSDSLQFTTAASSPIPF